jgi:hypothetical protein
LRSLNQQKVDLHQPKTRLIFTSETETTGKQRRKRIEEEKEAYKKTTRGCHKNKIITFFHMASNR